MNNNFKKLFTTFSKVEPSKNLLDRIMNRIERQERIAASRKIMFFGTALVASFIALIPAFQFVASSIAESGVGTFFSLIFSDLNNMVDNLSQFGLTIIESIPVMSIVLFLSIALVFLFALKEVVKNYYILNHHQTI